MFRRILHRLKVLRYSWLGLEAPIEGHVVHDKERVPSYTSVEEMMVGGGEQSRC